MNTHSHYMTYESYLQVFPYLDITSLVSRLDSVESEAK